MLSFIEIGSVHGLEEKHFWICQCIVPSLIEQNWTDKRGSEKFTWAFKSGELKLILCTSTHHYGNNLPGIAAIPCSDDDRWIVRGIIGSIIYDRTLHLKYQPAWLSIQIGVQFDGCKITQLQLISNRNKGFDCLDVNGFVRFFKKFQRMWLSHNLTQSYMHENYNTTSWIFFNIRQNMKHQCIMLSFCYCWMQMVFTLFIFK